MGTRGAYGFRLNEKDIITYNHMDSYPGELGNTMVEFIKATPDARLREIAEGIVLVGEGATPTDAQVRECKELGLVDLGVGSQSVTDWYCLLRGAQGEPEYLDKGLRYMIDSSGFPFDGLFCEWAYIINLDTMELEIYKGLGKNKKAPGRYAQGEDYEGKDHDYAGVALIMVVPLSNMRKLLTRDTVRALTVRASQVSTPEGGCEHGI